MAVGFQFVAPEADDYHHWQISFGRNLVPISTPELIAFTVSRTDSLPRCMSDRHVTDFQETSQQQPLRDTSTVRWLPASFRT